MAITIHEPVEVRPFERINGVQKIYRFANNVGASVIKGSHTYGGEDNLWEIAPTVYKDGADNMDFRLFYPKDICPDGDVFGWQTDDQVEDVLTKLSEMTAEQVAAEYTVLMEQDKGEK